MAPLARGEVYLGSCSGWLILMPGIPWIDLRCGGWRLPSDELKARRLGAPAARRPAPAWVGCACMALDRPPAPARADSTC